MESTQTPDYPQTSKHPMQAVMEILQGGNPDTVCTKYGLTREELAGLLESYQASRRQMALADNFSTHGQVGRNEPCPCGSGKKYKKCCLPKHEEARKSMSQDKVRRIEEQAQARERVQKEVEKGFDLLFARDFSRAGRMASKLLETYPEDDRLHDIAVSAALGEGKYDEAFQMCRKRWQVALEEKNFYQENGYHKRAGADGENLVNFYSPSTWLEKFWVASCARRYREQYPDHGDRGTAKLVEGLLAANDSRRFSGRQEEGFEMRKTALAPVIAQLEAAGPSAFPCLLPLTYTFSWASLFVPDVLAKSETDDSMMLLAELSMFRFPYFAQKCLLSLEGLGEKALSAVRDVLERDRAFDELKVGLIQVLGSIETQESFQLLAALTDHENPYVVNWVAQALGRLKNPEALPYLEKAKARLGELSKIAGAIRELSEETARSGNAGVYLSE